MPVALAITAAVLFAPEMQSGGLEAIAFFIEAIRTPVIKDHVLVRLEDSLVLANRVHSFDQDLAIAGTINVTVGQGDDLGAVMS